jgi:hypothetical protein
MAEGKWHNVSSTANMAMAHWSLRGGFEGLALVQPDGWWSAQWCRLEQCTRRQLHTRGREVWHLGHLRWCEDKDGVAAHVGVRSGDGEVGTRRRSRSRPTETMMGWHSRAHAKALHNWALHALGQFEAMVAQPIKGRGLVLFWVDQPDNSFPIIP